MLGLPEAPPQAMFVVVWGVEEAQHINLYAFDISLKGVGVGCCFLISADAAA